MTIAERGLVLIAEDDAAQRAVLTRWLERHGHEVVAFDSAEGALRALADILPDVICLDLRLQGMSGIEALEAVKSRHPRVPVVVLTADESIEPVVAAIRLGAFEYLRKPVTETKLLTTVGNAVKQGRIAVRLLQLEHEVSGWHYPYIIGGSPAMRQLFGEMDKVALTDVRVLIKGESGTGKELVARALHEASGRRSGPLRPVNCAAITDSLQESELFGHEKGAFTGASRLHRGHFEQAKGGTLFLDEVGELSLGLQAKLLRVLEERRFLRVGGSEYVESDCRIIAATNRDLAAEAAEGRFRQDLYFRLAVFELSVPPLRERGSDIPLLAETFARNACMELRGTAVRLSPEALNAVEEHSWPGNVRELQNAIYRASVLALDGVIRPDHLPAQVSALTPRTRHPSAPHAAVASATADAVAGGPERTSEQQAAAWIAGLPDMALSELESVAVRAAIGRYDGNLSAVARALGVSRTTLYRKMELYGIPRP